MTAVKKIIDFEMLLGVSSDTLSALKEYLRKEKEAMLELITIKPGENIVIDAHGYSCQVMLVDRSSPDVYIEVRKKTEEGWEDIGNLDTIGETFSFTDSEYQFRCYNDNARLCVCKQWLI